MDHDPADLLRRWLPGWARCRDLGEPAAADAGLRVTLDLPGRHTETFAPDADRRPGTLRSLAAWTAAAPRPAWLTVATRHPEEVALTMKRAGLDLLAEPGTLMAIDLARHPACPAPAPYTVTPADRASLLAVLVGAPDGEPAAVGTSAVTGRDAVMHGVRTETAHRRRGLGRVVMAELARRAALRGATTGILVASREGERLYTSLGWSTAAVVLTGRTPAST